MVEERKPDPFAEYRKRVTRSYWMIALQAVELGDILSRENHRRVYEILPENGMTVHTVDAAGRLTLLVSIPEDLLPGFEEDDWRIGRRMMDVTRLDLDLVVGSTPPLQCIFEFALDDEAQVQEVIQLTERDDVTLYGVTHMEEGLMLTVKGTVDLPEELRLELGRDLLTELQRRHAETDNGQSHGSV
ncbi:MAG TPA: hypothetical protein VFJ58_19975 [Armatimonadota bacterium]|nr:hypothetical protein [Armatimonadota bacterium]